MIVADTNVLSELMRPRPAAEVVEWAKAQTPGNLYTSSVTVAEIRYGLARLPNGRRRDELMRVADAVFRTLDGQVLAFDRAAAEEYAFVVRARDDAGRPISGFDAQISAICRVHHAALATHNVKDFELTGVDVVDPWLGT